MRRRVREHEEIGELNIVPYLDIVTNLLMFLLVSMAGYITLGVLDVGTPQIGEPDGGTAGEQESLNLSVAVTDQGFYLAAPGGVLADMPAEAGTARSPTVPLKNGAYDYAGLTAEVAKIKTAFPEEKRIILAAEMDIAYDIIIQTMDACREMTTLAGGESKRTSLFPEVWLSEMR